MKLKGQDWTIVVITFLIGMIAGSYMYIVGFAPNYEDIELPVVTESGDMNIVIFAETYGGDSLGTSPKFELVGSGRYTYTPFNPGGETAAAPVTGTLPPLLMEELTAVLKARTLKTASEEIIPESCEMFVDGVEYRYRVVLDEDIYVVDTCGTNFMRDSELATTLEKVWQYLNTSLAQ